MNFILNIGLKVGATQALAAHVALEIIKANEIIVGKFKVVESDTEPTLVCEVRYLGGPTWAFKLLHQIAVDLKQDCIAAYRPKTNGGALIGPNAKAWGEFNPAFFILPDGTRLSEQISQKTA